MAAQEFMSEELERLKKKCQHETELANFWNDKFKNAQLEIRKLREQNERLTSENMTHEYNQAEAERFAPEYERQIRGPLEEKISQLQKENEILKRALLNAE